MEAIPRLPAQRRVESAGALARFERSVGVHLASIRDKPRQPPDRLSPGLSADPGVPADTLDEVFRPFCRGAGRTSGNGYGLGLAIAERVIAAVNGGIQARNGEPGGIVVDLVLPA